MKSRLETLKIYVTHFLRSGRLHLSTEHTLTPCHMSIKAEDRLTLSQFVGEVISFAKHDHTPLGIF